MTRPAAFARAALLAALAAPATGQPVESIGFTHERIVVHGAAAASDRKQAGPGAQGHGAATPMLTPIDPLPNAGRPAGHDMVMKGSNILLNAAPAASSSKPKEIVVVGSKPPANGASRSAHPDFLWAPLRVTDSTPPATPQPRDAALRPGGSSRAGPAPAAARTAP
jgi:hypothetical protein